MTTRARDVSSRAKPEPIDEALCLEAPRIEAPCHLTAS